MICLLRIFKFQGEMKIPVSLEDEASRELPTAAELYKPIRQSVYSVLFNLNKLKIIHENQVKEKGNVSCWSMIKKNFLVGAQDTFTYNAYWLESLELVSNLKWNLLLGFYYGVKPRDFHVRYLMLWKNDTSVF